MFAEQSQRCAGFHLAAHVNLRSWIVAHEYGGEAWLEAAQAQALHLFGDLRLNGSGNSVSVQNGGWHFSALTESLNVCSASSVSTPNVVPPPELTATLRLRPGLQIR